MTNDTSPNQPAPKPKTRRWIKAALVVSLGLNLLVLGAVTGAVLSGKGGKGSHVQLAPGFTGYLRALDGDQRRALGKQIRAQRDGARINRSQVRAAFEPVLTALRAEPFNTADFEAALATQAQTFRDRNQTLETAGRAGLVVVLQDMSASDRMAFADRLEQAIQRGPKRNKPKNRD
ncbi:periplasmic heavy metal sensor [Algirhabdus cladophorae]|uniref:periplasmic heavy metal sensor n=1 Tax=Algirhabdus cladophorae TaxID=3377108 RepID=UPI003B8458D3